jgi:cobalamin biosynthesis Mg chelatase CobN
MLKKFVSLSLIYSLLLLSIFSAQVSAQQTQSNALKADALKLGELKTEPVLPKTDVKKVFSKELQKSKTDASVGEIDFKKLERIEMKSAAKAKMSKKEKTWIVIFIVALVVGGILLAIYGKLPKCSQVDCNPDYDENCYCDEGT